MERYKYRAINSRGRPVRGVVSAANEVDLYNQLQSAGMELLQCAPLGKKATSFSIGRKKVKVRDLIQLFVHLEQMQSAGVPMLDALADIRDTTDNDSLRDIMSEVYRDVSEGSALSEAMQKHPKVFGNLYISLVAAGEETGDMSSSYLQLVKYLKWVDVMQARIRKATRYPMILIVVLVATVVVMMGFVVPQIVDFIRNIGQELPIYTRALIATSDFFRAFWPYILAAPVVIFIVIKLMRKASHEFAYRVDMAFITMPVAGPLVRKISIARFAQTFGALYAAGIDVIQALKASQNTVTNLALREALDMVILSVQNGSPLSEAFNASGEFPSMVVRMLRIGEESGNLTNVLEQVSDFYTADVDEAVSALIAMIEPLLTAILGGMILWIAVAVFGPIYSSFENLEF
ncbi:MAG: type II secretion system F family protein [Alphaproteobacteria bacterium]|nr:type II secretion system F family protein [Alphaproteobacteria bacterium]